MKFDVVEPSGWRDAGESAQNTETEAAATDQREDRHTRRARIHLAAKATKSQVKADMNALRSSLARLWERIEATSHQQSESGHFSDATPPENFREGAFSTRGND